MKNRYQGLKNIDFYNNEEDKFAIVSGGALEDESEDGVDVAEAEAEHLPQGAPKKNWEFLCPRQKRRESQKAFEAVKEAADTRNVEPQKMAGAVLHRLVYQTNKGLAETAKRIEQGESVQPKQSVSISQAIWFVTMGAGFGKKQYRSVCVKQQRSWLMLECSCILTACPLTCLKIIVAKLSSS